MVKFLAAVMSTCFVLACTEYHEGQPPPPIIDPTPYVEPPMIDLAVDFGPATLLTGKLEGSLHGDDFNLLAGKLAGIDNGVGHSVDVIVQSGEGPNTKAHMARLMFDNLADIPPYSLMKSREADSLLQGGLGCSGPNPEYWLDDAIAIEASVAAVPIDEGMRLLFKIDFGSAGFVSGELDYSLNESE